MLSSKTDLFGSLIIASALLRLSIILSGSTHNTQVRKSSPAASYDTEGTHCCETENSLADRAPRSHSCVHPIRPYRTSFLVRP